MCNHYKYEICLQNEGDEGDGKDDEVRQTEASSRRRGPNVRRLAAQWRSHGFVKQFCSSFWGQRSSCWDLCEQNTDHSVPVSAQKRPIFWCKPRGFSVLVPKTGIADLHVRARKNKRGVFFSDHFLKIVKEEGNLWGNEAIVSAVQIQQAV